MWKIEETFDCIQKGNYLKAEYLLSTAREKNKKWYHAMPIVLYKKTKQDHV